MKSITSGIALVISALIMCSVPAGAQRAVALGVSGGLSIPGGGMGDVLSSGYNVGGHVNFAPPSLPFEIMLDLTYHGFDGDLELGTPDFRYFGVAGNAAYVFSTADPRPYVMGGLGMYFGKADSPGAESESEFGFDVGAGLRFMLSGLTTFLQVRANFVGDNSFFPVTFGILF